MLKACCPVVFDSRIHEIEKARKEERSRKREWFSHKNILGLTINSPQHQPANPSER
jgi:hypothetical protein